MTATTDTVLELDDIQTGALHERPSPYVGTYLLLRIDDRADGRELVRRLHRIVDPAAPRPTAAPRHVDHGRLHLPRPAGARRAAGVAGQLRAGVPARGWRHAPPSWATSARAAPSTGRSRWAPPTSTSPSPSSPRRRAAGGRRREGPPGPRGAARDRAGLAPGLLPAPDRADVVRLQGRHRPAGGRRQRPSPRRTRASGRSRPARSSSATPTRPASCRRCRPRRCSVATAPTWSSASCTPGWRPTASTCARPGRRPRRGGPPRRQDGRALAERGPARALAGRRRPRARRGPAAQQRLRLRRRPARLQVPARRPRAPREPAGRLRPGRQRQRPPPPHDPARHELRADAARRRPRGRRRRPGDRLRLRGSPPADGSSSSSRPSGSTTASSSVPRPRRTPSSDRTTRPATFTIPQRPIRRRLQNVPPFVVTRGGEYCFAPGLRAMQLAGGARA